MTHPSPRATMTTPETTNTAPRATDAAGTPIGPTGKYWIRATPAAAYDPTLEQKRETTDWLTRVADALDTFADGTLRLTAETVPTIRADAARLRSLASAIAPEEVRAAVADMAFYRRTHDDWARYFETHPEVAARYVATGEWDDAAEHRRICEKYDRVLRLLRAALAAAGEG
jgi:hypothetical protein